MTRRKVLMFCFGLIFFLSTGYLVHHAWQAHSRERVKQEMAKVMEQVKEQESPSADGAKDMLAKFVPLHEQNPEFAGWIRIEGTTLDYPVMKPAEDNNYYLTHGPDGKKSKYGAIYLDLASNLEDPAMNQVLYGHYFRDGSMFGLLEKYKEEAFFAQHPTIEFNTLYEEGTYEILSVFLSQVYDKNQEVFKYYRYTDIRTEEDFNDFLEQVQDLSLYDTGITATYGDRLITLSTCDYWTENGRLAVVAKKIQE